jgi:gas vesicle protein
MARNKTDVKSSRSITGAGKNTNSTQKKAGTGLKELTDVWQDFSTSMGNQLTELMEDNQAEYEKLHGTWTDLSKRFGAHVSENVKGGNKNYTEIYNIWKNYANKLSTRLTRLGNNGDIDFDTLMKNWENYTRKLNSELVDRDMDNNIHTFFTGWDSFYKQMTQQMNEIMQNGTSINSELSDTWNDFSTKMNSLLEKLAEDSTEAGELNNDWKNMSVELNREILQFIKHNESDFYKLQNEWLKNTERIGETLTDTYDLLSEGYGEIYTRYFERTAPYLKNLEGYSTTRVKALETEIDDLKKRIGKLEGRSAKK